MNDSSVETQEGGNLILVEFGPIPECGQDESSCLRASCFLFELLADRKIGRRNMHQNRILQNAGWNQISFDADHKIVTVSLSGLRHWGRSTCLADFLPMAMTITISWSLEESPKKLESLRPSKPSMGQVLSPSASAAIIRFSQARDVFLTAHLNSACRDTGGIPIILQKCRPRRIIHFKAPKTSNHPCQKNHLPKLAFFSCSDSSFWLTPASRIHSRWAWFVERHEPMSATATIKADAVSAGL